MALLVFEGFEAANSPPGAFALNLERMNAPSPAEGVPQIGRVHGTAAGSLLLEMPVGTQAAVTVGFGLRFSSGSISSGASFSVLDLVLAEVTQISLILKNPEITVEGSFVLQLVRGATVLATSDPFSTLQWLYLELHVSVDPTTGAYELRVDGEEEFSASGVNTANTASPNLDTLLFGSGASQLWFDDIYVEDGENFLDPQVVEAVQVVEDGVIDWKLFDGEDAFPLVRDLNDLHYIESTGADEDAIFGISQLAVISDPTALRVIALVAGDGEVRTIIFEGATPVPGTEVAVDSKDFVGIQDLFLTTDLSDVQIGVRSGDDVKEVQCTRVVGEVLGTPPEIESPPIPTNFKLFDHNWLSGCQVTTSFSTSVSMHPDSFDEHRLGLQDTPARSISFEWTVRPSRMAELKGYLEAISGEPTLVPLLPDWVKIQLLDKTRTVIEGDFALGRWFPGAVAIVAITDSFGSVVDWHATEIVSVSDTELVLAEAIPDKKAGIPYYVTPALFVDPAADINVELIAEMVGGTAENLGRVTATFTETAGPSALPAMTYDDFIVGDEPNRFQSFAVAYDRPSDREILGRALVVQPYGTKPRMAYSAGWTNMRRAKAWEKIRLFESRRGRLESFWFVEPERTHKVAPLGGAGTSVWLDREPDPLWDYFGVVLKDGRKATVPVVSVEETEKDGWLLTLGESLPWAFAQDEVCRVGAARLVRFGSDSLEEDWVLPAFSSTLAFELLEILVERDLDLE